ncbi:hypothetical protein EST38_g5870 [Candolleomyces aberdarensis]|uniref:Phytanoyl-CoA dioxygenase n=1 Tax=Candolleomyces aberdarensis TaxID=2316362 RepID=A0A4Q2DJH1_9AGAR|nr:hypothetical protein EST38_g5870 [Candolleomyces aberdarensis]
MASPYKYLSSEDVSNFLENGYIIVKNAFTKEGAEEWVANLWPRLGYNPGDKSTWSKERVHMPAHRREKVETFAPKAWAAILDLLGGEDRVNEYGSTWGDSFIVNLGTPELESAKVDIPPQDLDNWHVDGDFFIHFLDSPEQALLVVPIFSDIQPRGGGTMISPDGLDLVAQYLAAHPEGVTPVDLKLIPSNRDQEEGCWSHLKEIKRCRKFVELTGQAGDVVLMHPLMMHSASKNYLRIPRVITNPPVALKEPFNFNRGDPAEYSLVERKTLRALGMEKLDFKPTTERRRIVPARVLIQQKMLEEEKNRLEARVENKA